ncbi:hypothetical protein GCM10027162_71060 [Streptomyces incanus]
MLVEVLGCSLVANATGAESRASGDMTAVAAAVTMARRSFMKTSGSRVYRRLRYASGGGLRGGAREWPVVPVI